MGHTIERVENDELVGEKGAVAHRALEIEGARVVARDWGVLIQPGVLGISRVKGAANEVIGAIMVRFEWL